MTLCTRSALAAALFALAVPSVCAGQAYTDKVNALAADVDAQIHLKHLDDSVRQSLAPKIAGLRSKAADIDKLQKALDSAQHRVDDLDVTWKNAKSKADGLADDLQSDGQAAVSKVQSLIDQLGRLCRSLGGNWNPNGGESACTKEVSCQSDHPEVCESQKRQFEGTFNAESATVNRQLAALRKSLEEKQQRVQDASDAADSAKSGLDAATADRDTAKQALADAQQAFDSEFNDVESEIGNTPAKPLPIGHSPTLDTLIGIDNHQRANQGDTAPCYNNGGCVGSQSSSQVQPPSVPAASTPEFKKARDNMQSQLDAATQKSDTARAAYEDAVRNHAPLAEFNQKLKEFSEAEKARINLQFNVKMLDTGLLKPVPPKPAATSAQ
jgi:predicted  nucleic acid-binding Zn-ribbon protein